MVARNFKVTSLVIAAVFATAAGVATVVKPFQGPPQRRVLRVGVDESPPFYSLQPDGTIRGLGVDVLNEAARRRGIALRWVALSDTPIDDALRSKLVDLWPLAAATNSRKGQFFVSDPWLESDYVLVSKESRPVRTPAEAAGLVVAHARLHTTAAIVERLIPKSRFLVKLFRADAVSAMCRDEATAAVVESLLLDAILLDRPEGCGQQSLKIASLTGATTPLSIVAGRAASKEAASLRKEISELARSGFLSHALDEWSPFSAQGTRSIWAREEAEQRSRIYRICMGLILVFSLFLMAEIRRAFRQKRAAQQMLTELQASEQRWQLALSGAGDGLWDWDVLSGTVFRSPRWKNMLGYEESEIGCQLGDWLGLLHPEDASRAKAALDAHLKRESRCYSCDYRMLAKDGTWRWISDRGQAVWNELGNPIRMAGSHADITSRKQEQETLSLEARTDALTGLWNRREFDRAIHEQMELAAAAGGTLTVCAFDLDEFKHVNDLYGHAAGDRVLVKFAGVLRENLRKSDIICRLGGDEFVVILPGTAAEQATALASRVCTELRRVRFESAAEVEFRVRCSFGVGQSGEQNLLLVADELLYQAKEKARQRVFAA